ncbi:MAG: undecaprenyldiphospho-muramoylpentapeptide beta-N-acetylglucosaminyltransferase [Alphaproteobacteria bacterium]|nr:undecaprenyldiphospho-muramoylpentapeptide beta-N-acetylglucosaminyltransferase [Alphaproteobacteria bacterium]
MTEPILLAAGGTGGHLFPAEALAEVLCRRGVACAFVTDRRGAARLAGRDVAVHVVRSAPLAGRGVGGRVRGVVDLLAGTFQARRFVRAEGARAVVGFGGYPSVPPVLAASRLGVRTVIHEQNAVLGRANRLLAPRVDAIATSFVETLRVRSADRARCRVVGNPVRRAIAALAETPYQAPRDGGPVHILVTGGSQGARVMADVVPAALARVRATVRARVNVAQQCRPEDLERVRAAYHEAGIAADLATFFDDMPRRLAWAHLAVMRAGASTVAELALAGRPAILVPYPFASDDHQTANARDLEAAGAAWAVPEAALTPEALAVRIEALADAPDTLAATALRVRTQGCANAAEALADLVLGVAGANGGHHPREAAA